MEHDESIVDNVSVCSAREVVKRHGPNIEVAEGSQLSFSPSNPEFVRAFARVKLTVFADLQTLGFVPRRLSEDKIRHAIDADNDAAYKFATTQLGFATTDGDCHCGGAPPTFSLRLREAYRGVRRDHHPALARTLSDHYGTRFSWDDPVPRLVAQWVSYFDERARLERPFLVALLEDITIHRNAILAVDPSLRALYANDIWIHRRGTLSHRGAYVRIWANRIQSFFGTTEITADTTRIAAWKLEGA
jgi:hypothetical protein